METQNVTLTVPKEILLKAKILAVQRRTSVSALLTQTLEELVQHEEDYSHARLRHLEWLNRGVDLGTRGRMIATRDELHERNP